ncbi:MAG: helix-turn-helix domain-containing protein [Aggregatilineales bacterium]
MPFSAERLKQARQRAGLSQAQLGRRLGVVFQQVAKWEQKVSAPTPDTLGRLAQILGCTTDWLLELVDEPNSHLYDTDLSEDERQLILLYRRGELPNLIQRLVTELAEGNPQKDPLVDRPGKPDVAPQDVAASR